MRGTVQILLFASAVCSRPSSRQQPPPGQQGQNRPGPRGLGGRNTPTFPGPPPGSQALPPIYLRPKSFIKIRSCRPISAISAANAAPASPTLDLAPHRNNPPSSASWSDCSADYPRDKIVSPYPYKTAKEHYETLLAAAKAKGGPTVYTKATTPDWDGFYTATRQPTMAPSGSGHREPSPHHLVAAHARISKTHGADELPRGRRQRAAVGSVSCYPEGFLRWWAQAPRAETFSSP